MGEEDSETQTLFILPQDSQSLECCIIGQKKTRIFEGVFYHEPRPTSVWGLEGQVVNYKYPGSVTRFVRIFSVVMDV